MSLIHKFKQGENYFVLDVNTGAVHIVDELVYDLVDGKVLINDPNSELASKECALVEDFVNEVKYYFVVDLKEVDLYMLDPKFEDTMHRVLRGEDTQVSDYAKIDWQDATSSGITDGTRPGGYATREEVISMLLRALRR